MGERDDQSFAVLGVEPGAIPSDLRERIVARLSDRFAHGTLEIEEFERRIALAHSSQRRAELEALVSDLAVPAGTTVRAPPTRAPQLTRPEGMVVAILGGAQRQGGWAVPRNLRVLSFMGGVVLDFREAQLPAGVVQVQVATLMGGVHLIVPPHLAVEVAGVGIMGGFDHRDAQAPGADPGGTVLHVGGIAVMGGVHVEIRHSGETEREAKKRRRLERQEQKRQEKKRQEKKR